MPIHPAFQSWASTAPDSMKLAIWCEEDAMMKILAIMNETYNSVRTATYNLATAQEASRHPVN